MMTVRTIGTVLTLTILSAACQTDPLDRVQCGVELPDPLSTLPPGDRLTEFVELAVVGTEPESGIGIIRGAAVLGEHVAVAEAVTEQVHIFDFGGTLVAQQGGQGFGEEEYVFLTSIASNGEFLIALDTFHNRLTVLDREGNVVRTLHPDWDRPRYHSGKIVSAAGDLALIEFVPNGYQGESRSPIRLRQDLTFVLVELRDGSVLYQRRYPGSELLAARIGQFHGGLPVIFGHRTTATLTDSGAWFLDTERAGLEFVGVDGEPCFIAFSHDPIEVAQQWVTSVRDSMAAEIAAMKPEASEVDAGQSFNHLRWEFSWTLLSHGVPARSTLPYGSDLKASSDGSLWLRGYPVPEDSLVTWIRIDPTSMAADIQFRLPSDLNVLDLGDSRLVATELAHDGTRRIVTHDY
jgi:hypothetical protein